MVQHASKKQSMESTCVLNCIANISQKLVFSSQNLCSYPTYITLQCVCVCACVFVGGGGGGGILVFASCICTPVPFALGVGWMQCKLAEQCW